MIPIAILPARRGIAVCAATCLFLFAPHRGEATVVVYLPFSGNANDVSGNGHNGTVVEAVLAADRNGNPNSAYAFDGVNDHIDVGAPLLGGSDDFTIGFWLKSSGVQNTYTVPLSQGHYGLSSTSGFAFQYGFPSSSSMSFIWGNGGSTFSSINQSYNPVTDSDWHYLTATKSGNVITTYKDGVFSGSSAAGLVFGTYSFTIGQDTYNTDSNHRSFKGLIDDVVVFNNSLTDTEVGQLFNGTYTITPEPSCALLLVTGAALIVFRRRARVGGL